MVATRAVFHEPMLALKAVLTTNMLTAMRPTNLTWGWIAMVAY